MSNSTPEARLRRVHDNVEYPLVGEVILGRHSDCDIVIDDEGGVSRRHARLTGSSDGVFVSDLGSLNGTLVNGDEAAEQTQLQNGDRLVFDEYEYEVIIPVAEEADFDEEVTRIANREEMLERFAAASAASKVESTEAPPASVASSEVDIAIDNEVIADADTADEITSSDIVAPEFDRPETAEIKDSTRNPSLDSSPQIDDIGSETSDDADLSSSISASDPFDRIIADPFDAELGESAAPSPVSILEEQPVPERASVEPPEPEPEPEPELAAPTPEPSSAEAPAPEVEPVPVEPVPVPVAAPPVPEPPPRQPETPAESPVADRAAPAEPQQQTVPDVPSEADLPGAWANTAAMMNTDNHTMIAQYVVPARNAPAEVDISTITVPALVIRTGDFEGKVLTLNAPSTEWLVGSGAASDLRIKQEGISSRHAVFVREQNKLKLCDEMSVNGTFVNGNRINVGYVGHGDVLRFGPVECELLMPNFKRGLAGGRKGSPSGADAGRGARKKKRGSKTWLKWLLVAAVLIPVIAIAVLLLLPK